RPEQYSERRAGVSCVNLLQRDDGDAPVLFEGRIFSRESLFDFPQLRLRLGWSDAWRKASYHLPPVAGATPICAGGVNHCGNQKHGVVLQESPGRKHPDDRVWDLVE